MREAAPDLGAVAVKSHAQPLADEETARLVPLAQSGDSAALAEIYMRHFDNVYAYLRVALNDAQEAEDATQQVFTKVLESLDSYEQRGQPFRAWLFRIARNQAIDHLRKHGRVEVEEPARIELRRAPDSGADLRALQWTSDGEILMLVERLPAGQRQVIVLRYVLEFSTSEIAEILERSQEAVRQLHSRALRFLEQRLTALGREPCVGSRRLASRAHGRRGALRPAHAFTLAR
jgi:RNA polymerase sigma-70 factor (ECF subfamily)